MALVLYHAAIALANANQNPILTVGQQQLAPFVHSPQARGVLALPGQDVEFVRNAITARQVGSHRPSYINGILIQSRGQPPLQACDACNRITPGLRPFPECRKINGHFGGACSNCKWRDHASRCSVRDSAPPPPPPPPSPPSSSSSSSSDHGSDNGSDHDS